MNGLFHPCEGVLQAIFLTAFCHIRGVLLSLHKSKTARTIAVFASGNMVAMLLGTIGSLVQARYIGPEDMGVLRTFTILTGYLTFLHMGVFDGLQREIPMQLGRGDREKAEQAAAACLVWIIFISLAGSVLFLALAARAAFAGDWMRFWGWLAFLPGIVMAFYGCYLGVTFRTGQQFISLTKASLIHAIVGTLLLPLLPFLGYYAACLRVAVGSVVHQILLHRWRPMKVRPRLDWASFWEVIRLGLPLSAVGYVATSLWMAVEGTLVLEWFGLKTLGLYAVAMFIRTIVVQMANNVNNVVSVKIYERFGRTNNIKDCFHFSLKPMLFSFMASWPLVIAGWFLLASSIPLLLPKYVDAIFLAQLMLLMMPIAFLKLIRVLFRAAGRWHDCAASDCIGFPVFLSTSFLLYRLGYGPESVVIGSLLGMVAGLTVSFLLLLRLLLQNQSGCSGRKDELTV